MSTQLASGIYSGSLKQKTSCMGKEGRTETTGGQETSKVLKVTKTSKGVIRIRKDSQTTREDRGSIKMIDLSKDSEMEDIKGIS